MLDMFFLFYSPSIVTFEELLRGSALHISVSVILLLNVIHVYKNSSKISVQFRRSSPLNRAERYVIITVDLFKATNVLLKLERYREGLMKSILLRPAIKQLVSSLFCIVEHSNSV